MEGILCTTSSFCRALCLQLNLLFDGGLIGNLRWPQLRFQIFGSLFFITLFDQRKKLIRVLDEVTSLRGHFFENGFTLV
ncbi:hypothetical protein ACDW_20870 [Acidovorax sp. DW039]|nr:hypothetical protein ACDW_20870 [Acidovorax sp. DW039]